MNKTLTVALAVAMFTPLYAVAAPTLYGKANVSYASTKETTGVQERSTVVLESNASRIGVKGSEAIADTSLEGIYQAEFEVAFDDGANGDKNDKGTFSQRNIFLGVKGNFGSVIAGHFDTPFKNAQNKVDLFNDLYGDIKNTFTLNEKREKNSLMYTSPTMAGFTLNADLIASEDNRTDAEKGAKPERSNGASLSATYENRGFYGAFAYDLDVVAEGTSAARGVLQYTVASVQLGFLAEQYEPAEKDADKVNGVFGSIKYTINDWALLAQYGQSDIKKTDGTTLSLGADYTLSKNAKLFGFYISNAYVTKNATDSTQVDTDMDYLGVGMELKF